MVGAGALVLLVAGRGLGLPELFVLAAVALSLLVACLVWIRLTRLDLEVGRVIQPAVVHVGTAAHVELRLRNRRTRRTPVLRLRDPVSGTRGANLLVPPLRGGAATVASYRLPTRRRGLLRVGPLDVLISDPFGLSRLAVSAAPRIEMVVFPKVDALRPIPHTPAHDPQAGIRMRNTLGRTGEEFYALRNYVVGDDLRRIHWPSSARHDELLVRQNELPWQARTTVLLDVRRSSNPGEALEVAVSAAASIVTASAARGDLVRMLTTDGADSDFGPGVDHLRAIMEHLAVVRATNGANLRRSLDAVSRRSSGGALVVVLAEAPDDDLRAVAPVRSRYGSLTLVQVDRSSWDPSAPSAPASPAAARLGVVQITRDQPLPAAWDAHLARRSLRRGPLVGSRS
jgi:uncharacterized protein (DUF58 family)